MANRPHPDTRRTSNIHYLVRAYADCDTPEGIRKIRFLISTEKLGDLVLLGIEDIGPEGRALPPARGRESPRRGACRRG